AAIGAPLGLALLLLPAPAGAFDTGHHADLTREVLKEQGFSQGASDAVVVENWLVDYFVNDPVSPLQKDCDVLHFDNAQSTTAIRNYWGRLTVNSRKAVEDAAREKDALKLLTLLGVSLHAVQDFYTHSNWVETHPRASADPYRSETWFSAGPG